MAPSPLFLALKLGSLPAILLLPLCMIASVVAGAAWVH